jgi:hypothetical protein
MPEGRNAQRPVIEGHRLGAASSGPERSNERVSEGAKAPNAGRAKDWGLFAVWTEFVRPDLSYI